MNVMARSRLVIISGAAGVMRIGDRSVIRIGRLDGMTFGLIVGGGGRSGGGVFVLTMARVGTVLVVRLVLVAHS